MLLWPWHLPAQSVRCLCALLEQTLHFPFSQRLRHLCANSSCPAMDLSDQGLLQHQNIFPKRLWWCRTQDEEFHPFPLPRAGPRRCKASLRDVHPASAKKHPLLAMSPPPQEIFLHSTFFWASDLNLPHCNSGLLLLFLPSADTKNNLLFFFYQQLFSQQKTIQRGNEEEDFSFSPSHLLLLQVRLSSKIVFV